MMQRVKIYVLSTICTFLAADRVEKRLNRQNFFRSHRSCLVNKKYIRKVEKWGDRSYEIEFAHTAQRALLSRGKVGILKYLNKAGW